MRPLCCLIMLNCAAAKVERQLNFLLDSLVVSFCQSSLRQQSHCVSLTGTMRLRFGLSAAVELHMAKLTEKNEFV